MPNANILHLLLGSCIDLELHGNKDPSVDDLVLPLLLAARSQVLVGVV